MRGCIYFTIQFLSTLLTYISCAPTPITSDTTNLQFITLEEHYDSEAIRSYNTDPVYQLLGVDPFYQDLLPLVENINGSRLDSMSNNSIRIQVVSQDPTPVALDLPELCSQSNDELAAAIAPYPDRFRGFCFLPMAQPASAAAELDRCISQLGFVGALVDSHLANNTFFDGPEYDSLWSTFERLGVPLYLHPTYPLIQQVNGSTGLYTPDNNAYSSEVSAALGTAAWGWHSDCGLQFLRLWVSGVFDRHPNLKFVLGHMGEMLPYMLSRSDSILGSMKSTGATIRETWAKNIWVTTSGFFSLDPFATLWKTTAKDRIMYSVDYPWATNEEGTQFMNNLKASEMVTDEEWNNIAFGNAETLLGLK